MDDSTSSSSSSEESDIQVKKKSVTKRTDNNEQEELVTPPKRGKRSTKATSNLDDDEASTNKSKKKKPVAKPDPEPIQDGTATSSSDKPKPKRKRPAVDAEPPTELHGRSSLDDSVDYIRRVRESLDVSREYYPHDARKSIEMPPRSEDVRASVEMRRSLELFRVVVDEDGKPVKPTKDAIEPATGRRSIEKDMEKTETDPANILNSFPKSEGLTTEQAEELLHQYGRNELPEKIIPKWYIFLSLLWQPMPVMIWIAAIVDASIGNWIDTIVLVAINLFNAGLGYYETTQAGNAVAALKASLKPTAIVMRDGVWENQFDARLLVPGDLVELAAGSAVPADCMINSGTIEVDESAMTGESLPVNLHERDMAKMGSTVARGETHATVVYTGKDTFFGKTASMLTSDDGFSNLQRLLLRVMIILCVMAFILCFTAFLYLGIKHKNWKEALSFGVVVLVASIPMAIEIVTTSTLAIGSRVLSKYGAIVSRLAAIEDLAGLNMLCSDKTGTLTKNKMEIQEDAPTYEPGLDQMDLLKQAALAAKWEAAPKDALDTLFLRCHLWRPTIKEELAAYVAQNPNVTQAEKDAFYNDKINESLQEALKDYEQLAFMPFDPRVKRTESTVRVKSTGVIYKITKGAPHVIQALDADIKKGEKLHDKVSELAEDGIRSAAMAISEPLTDVWDVNAEEQDPNMKVVWHLTGILTFLDPPRDDTKDTIARSQALGVPVRMITGDHLLIAKKTCKDLQMGVLGHPDWPTIQGPDHLPLLDADGKTPDNLVSDYGEYIQNADGFAQVFPEHKFLIVETYRRLGFKCGMTGDGVNDAPALKRADVGIAVAGATDAARAAADIILTQEGLGTIIIGLKISRIIFARMKSFLTYRIAATLQLLLFFFIAVFAFSPRDYVKDGLPGNSSGAPVIPGSSTWPEFFSLPVIYLIIITVINDGTLISIGYDHATPSPSPERWVLPVLFIVSSSLAAIACFSSLLWLWWSLDSWSTGSFFRQLGIGGIDQYGHIVNMMFLKVAVSDILTLFSSRTSHQFFFQRKPHFVLFISAIVALGITTTLALVWPCSTLDKVPVCGLVYKDNSLLALWVWIYCIIVFLIQDAVKVGTWWIIRHFNLFNVLNEVPVQKLSEHEEEMTAAPTHTKAINGQSNGDAAPKKKRKPKQPKAEPEPEPVAEVAQPKPKKKKAEPEPEPESESESEPQSESEVETPKPKKKKKKAEPEPEPEVSSESEPESESEESETSESESEDEEAYVSSESESESDTE